MVQAFVEGSANGEGNASLMMGVKKLLAGTGAVALFASAAVIGIAVSPAQAAGQTITVTPNTGLKGGQVVSVTYSGFSPNAPVALGVCPTGRAVKGPGDCGRSKNGNSKLTTADASGKGTAQITVPEGALGNATPPAAKCPPCSMGATNISNAAETANVELKYATAGGAAKAATTPKTTTPKAATAPKAALAKTGPRETMIMALVGFALLQVGLVFAVRANRSAPRRSAV